MSRSGDMPRARDIGRSGGGRGRDPRSPPSSVSGPGSAAREIPRTAEAIAHDLGALARRVESGELAPPQAKEIRAALSAQLRALRAAADESPLLQILGRVRLETASEAAASATARAASADAVQAVQSEQRRADREETARAGSGEPPAPAPRDEAAA